MFSFIFIAFAFCKFINEQMSQVTKATCIEPMTKPLSKCLNYWVCDIRVNSRYPTHFPIRGKLGVYLAFLHSCIKLINVVLSFIRQHYKGRGLRGNLGFPARLNKKNFI